MQFSVQGGGGVAGALSICWPKAALDRIPAAIEIAIHDFRILALSSRPNQPSTADCDSAQGNPAQFHIFPWKP
jgi:hypothetical protein